MQTTIVIGEDHPIIRRGLISLLGETDDLQVFAEAATPDAVRAAVREHDPVLVILPIRFGDRTTGLDLCRDLKSETRSLVLIYTAFTTPEDQEASLLAGADGMVDKLTMRTSCWRTSVPLPLGTGSGSSPIAPHVRPLTRFARRPT